MDPVAIVLGIVLVLVAILFVAFIRAADTGADEMEIDKKTLDTVDGDDTPTGVLDDSGPDHLALDLGCIDGMRVTYSTKHY